MQRSEDNAAIFGTAPGMFPSSRGQGGVDCASNPPIQTGLSGSKPGVDHQARPCVEAVGLAREIDVVHGVEERCR